MKTERIALLCGVLLACGLAYAAKTETKPDLLANHAKAEDGRTKVLLLQPNIKMFQLGASGVTTHEIPEWSQQAEQHAVAALRAFATNSKRMAEVPMPALSAEETVAVEEYLALADTVAYTAFVNRTFGGKAWKHKQAEFDYELGPSLRFLRERTGADVAVFAVGVDAISSGGRVAMSILFAAAGVGIPMGQTFMVVGIVELETGRILWVNHRVGSSDMRKADNVYEYVDALMCQYPKGTIMGDSPKACGLKWQVADDGTLEPKRNAKGARR